MALLFGLLAAAGLALTYRDGAPALVKANDAAAPAGTALQQPQAALLAATGEALTITPRAHWDVDGSYSSSEPPVTQAKPQSSASTAGTVTASNHATEPADAPTDAPQPQNHPVTSNTRPVPQAGAGQYANEYAGQLYAPLGCELPAGCGVAGGYVTRQTSGTSGGLPAVHDSQGSNSSSDNSGPPPGNGSPQTNDSGQNPLGQTSDPPGKSSDPPAVSAPELDPATLAAAVTLLLGALTIVRGRRTARATR